MSNAEKVVMVPRKPTPAMLEAMRAPRGETMDGYPNPATLEDRYTAAIDAAPEQHQGEPVALPEMLSRDHTEYPRNMLIADGFRAGMQWMRQQVVKLGPLYTHPAPVVQKGEPVYQLRNTVVGNVWRDADKEAYDSASNLAEYERRVLYTHADAGEVERLRAELVEWKKRCQYNANTAHDVGHERDTLRAQLAERDALLHEAREELADWAETYGNVLSADTDLVIEKIDAALSASAEPSAPVERDEQELFESVFPMPSSTTKFKGGYAATEFNAWDAHKFCNRWDGWKARAALSRK